MKYADSMVPMLTSQMEARCTLGETRPLPNIQMPRKVDSRKNARRASTASGAPKTLPT